MSVYGATLRTEMEPISDQIRELRELPKLNDEQQTELKRLNGELKARMASYDEFMTGYQESVELEQKFKNLRDPVVTPRAQYDGPSTDGKAARGEQKGWFDLLTETKGFQRAVRDNGLFRESLPSESLYPFFEQKAPFAVTNPLLLTGPMEVYNQFTTRNRHPVLDLITTVQDNRYAIPYLPLTFTNAADEVAWGAAKPESTNAGTIVTVNMVTIAHWKEVIRQQLHYLPGLRGEVENELAEGVLRVLENRVLNGTGTGGEMSGLLTQATLAATGADLVLQILNAIGTVESNGGIVDAILVNPLDYQTLLGYQWTANTTNLATAGGGFFGYRVVKSSAMPAGKAIVADWAMAARLYIGDALNVSSTEALGYKNNVVTFRAEIDAVTLLARPWLLVECTAAMPVTPAGLGMMSFGAQGAGATRDAGTPEPETRDAETPARSVPRGAKGTEEK